MSEKLRIIERICGNCQFHREGSSFLRVRCSLKDDSDQIVERTYTCSRHSLYEEPVTADDRQETENILHSKASSSRPTCKTCEWFADSSGICDNCGSSADGFHEDDCSVAKSSIKSGKRQIGQCRSSSPSVDGFPSLFSDDWCGDYEARKE